MTKRDITKFKLALEEAIKLNICILVDNTDEVTNKPKKGTARIWKSRIKRIENYRDLYYKLDPSRKKK